MREWRALHVSHGAGFELFEAHALQLIGESYLKLGDAGQAMKYNSQQG